ncbi:MAG: hypothetical protein GAK29_04375 [Acinetobacter bereziniae]|uniref:Uncharacterized protein n=1 Tax=Acinetobacter bereziniae TaxID=106648 RepID=A0A833PAB8_ACIBZ|nr:MAG: hypothetical protein GAK29_04375 [Acinetobacter bereziniae]
MVVLSKLIQPLRRIIFYKVLWQFYQNIIEENNKIKKI